VVVKAAVCGGLGFIGSRVARDLQLAGHDVTILDFTDEPWPVVRAELPAPAELRVVDFTDAAATREAIGDAELVFHAAAQGSKTEREAPAPLLDLNLMGLGNVLEAMRLGQGKRIVLASSAVVYGEAATGALREDDRIEDVVNLYAATKLAGEMMLRAYQSLFGLSGLSLRFFNVYGHLPGRLQRRELIPLVLDKLDSGERPVIHGSGTSTFDFIHVDDVSAAVVAGLQSDAVRGELNVGTGRSTSVLDLVRLAIESTGASVEADVHPEIAVPTRHVVADVGAARREIGFEAKIDLASGLRRMVAERAAEQQLKAA
jgi:UDP-glucose 4-epimerase